MKGEGVSVACPVFELDAIVTDLLHYLKNRPKEVMVRRFGLGGQPPQVLDQIGRDFSITRERVRQIERDSFKRLHAVQPTAAYDQLIQCAQKILEHRGGFCERTELKQTLIPGIVQTQRNQLMFILNSSKLLRYNKGSLVMNGFWYQKGELTGSQITAYHQTLVDYIKAHRKPCKFSQLLAFMRQHTPAGWFEGELGQRRMIMLLTVSRVIEQNMLGEWGVKNWRVISERGTREKAFLVLRKYRKPLHFHEITAYINQHWAEKQALPQTVHNELIKDSRFVLVGRGMYGLADWGFDEGTVKDIIIKYLKENQIPQHRHEIVRYVLSKKRVKKTTVLVNLADRNTFIRDREGKFTLKIV